MATTQILYGGLSANTFSATTIYLGNNQLSSNTTFTGGTISGETTFTNGVSANTISASTIDMCSTNGTLYTSSISGCSPINILSEVNINNGLTATTISATTLYGDGSNLINVGGGSYTYEIGEYVPSQGGVIFHRYLDDTNENYLLVDTTDLSTASTWSNVTSTLIGSTAQSTWDGLSNSNAIVGQSSFTSGAAKLCLDSTNNSQTDWYLPAIDELSLLWQNRFNVNRTLSGNSSFGAIIGATEIGFTNYWSSSENAATQARSFTFANGYALNISKINAVYVRAVRKFSI